MSVIFYIIAALALVLAVISFGLIASDIQIIVALVLVNIALTAFGFARLLKKSS